MSPAVGTIPTADEGCVRERGVNRCDVAIYNRCNWTCGRWCRIPELGLVIFTAAKEISDKPFFRKGVGFRPRGKIPLTTSPIVHEPEVRCSTSTISGFFGREKAHPIVTLFPCSVGERWKCGRPFGHWSTVLALPLVGDSAG